MNIFKKIILYAALASPYVFILLYITIASATPGYDHLRHSISRLSLGRYGLYQTLNIIQFSVGLLAMISLVKQYVSSAKTAKEISLMYGSTAITLALLAVFPTDPIDSFPKQITSVSRTAMMHFALVWIFVLYAPVRIIHLYYAFRKDTHFKDLTRFTVISGWLTFTLSIVWFICFYFGVGNQVRGIFQKSIAMILVYWIIVIMRRTASIIAKR